MPKRKSPKYVRRKTEPKTKIPKPNSSEAVENSDEVIVDNDSKCWMNLLPNEVLELIYSFLSPKSLLALASLNCGRISELTRKARYADFSSCNDILPSEIQEFFSANAAHYVRDINFSNIFFMNTSDIVKAIARCKFLTFLTIIECGVTFEHVQHILMQCKQLKELRWNVLIAAGEDTDMWKISEFQLKKLYLHIDCPKSSEMAFYLLKHCPSLSEACFNFTSFLSPHLPLRTCQKNIVYKLHQQPNCPVNIVLDDYFENMRSVYECIMATKWCNCSNPVGSLHMPMTSPYLQVVASTEEYPSLAAIPDKSVQKLVLYYSNKVFLRQKMPDIKRVMGKSLSFLAVKEIEVLSTEVDAEDEEEDNISMSDVVPNLISDCSYIQVLILSPIHFNESIKLELLHHLKGLKTLGLSSCAFKSGRYPGPDMKPSPQQKSFEEFVKNVKDVEHFSLTNCEHRCLHRGPRDKDLLGISKWSRLKTLTLINVNSLQFMSFLRNIAEECPNFKSLEIVDTSCSSIVHHYIPSVMSLLSIAPQLIQLCINMDILCIKNQRFWDAISSAKKLQSLCLSLRAATGVSPKSIADAVQELPLLHLFHLNSPTINEGLALRVTRIMKRHGVKYPKVEMTTLTTLASSHINCDSPHLYIP